MIRTKELMKRDLIAVGSEDAEFEASVRMRPFNVGIRRDHVAFLFHPRLVHCLPLRGPSHGLHSLATRGRRGMERLAR